MTAFSSADLPASVNSVEKLALWAATVLQHLNPSLTIIEESGKAELAAQSGPFFIAAANPPEWRVISRSSIAVAPTWQRTGKIWQHAIDLSTTAIPAEFKS